MTTVFGDRDIIVVDLGFGDAGKGATVDWLCAPDAGLDVAAVVRFNGGAQAAHNVVVDGRHHTFSQFGPGPSPAFPRCCRSMSSSNRSPSPPRPAPWLRWVYRIRSNYCTSTPTRY